MCKYFFLQLSFGSSVHSYVKEVHALLCFSSELLGVQHAGSVFTNKEQKKAGSWSVCRFCSTCWPCSWHHWHRLLGTKWQHSWSHVHNSHTFFLSFSTNKTRNLVKTTLSSSFFFFFFFLFCYYSIPINMAWIASSSQFPFKYFKA